MPTIHDVLGELRATSLDERDKGDKFERLIKAYLTTDPEWTTRFSNVWLWTEWPGRQGRTDTGIDLVAEHRDRDGLAAIQCKFYEAGHKVAKSDIDSFVSASARTEFTARYVFDTAAGWTGNAEETLEGVVQRVDINYLDDARIDWSQYSWSTPTGWWSAPPTGCGPTRRRRSRRCGTGSPSMIGESSSWLAVPARRSRP